MAVIKARSACAPAVEYVQFTVTEVDVDDGEAVTKTGELGMELAAVVDATAT
jgi:hypothetical protein